MQNTGFFSSFSKNGPAAAGPKGYSVGRGPHTKVLVPPAWFVVVSASILSVNIPIPIPLSTKGKLEVYFALPDEF